MLGDVLHSMQRETNEELIVNVDSKRRSIEVSKPQCLIEPHAGYGSTASDAPKSFTFDNVYGVDSVQSAVFEQTAQPIVDSVLAGYNGTIFAYGQTGTGKTFTMEGVPDDPNLRGITPNAFYHIFDAVNNAPGNVEFLVRASFLEIYNDEVFDLLNKEARKKMSVKESKDKGVFVKDLSTYVVKSVDDLLKVLKKGQKSRRVGATKMNEGSSRSHSMMTVTIETSIQDDAGTTHYKVGKLNLVDLAGSERQKKTEATGDRLNEAFSINQSLATLGMVFEP